MREARNQTRRLGLLAALLAKVALAASASACGTLAGAGEGDVDLPSALDGPFRMLKRSKTCSGDACTGVDELPAGTANGILAYPPTPIARAASALRLGVGDDLHLALYVERAGAGPSEPRTIARMESDDARTYPAGAVVEVLRGDQPGEGGAIGDPWILREGAEHWLYYSIHAAPTLPSKTPGIARARASDGAGLAFARDGLITLDGPKGAWETEPPRAPSVARDGAGLFHLFYASGGSIGEATSADGLHFTRVGLEPALAPSPAPTAELPAGVKPPFDDRAVDDPCVERVVSPLGRVEWRVLYGGRGDGDARAIGLAARFGDAGPLTRNPASVFSTKLHANAPAYARFDSFALLFPTQDQSSSAATFEPSVQGIGVAISPAKIFLPLAE